MLDRQDIDALLISALYGELTPADEARLAAHLESHPTDRTALADLTRARTAVHESRILEAQLDPPQSVSAMLLQEAARRAPRRVDTEKQSWLHRVMMSFVAHPAMAAAATLVLVVGVAGSIYMKNGSEPFADKTVASSRSNNNEVTLAPTVEPEMKAPARNISEAQKPGATAELAKKGEATAGSAFQARLDDTLTTKPDAPDGRARGATQPAPAHAAPARDPQRQGIVVTKEPPAGPRDFEDKERNRDKSGDVGATNADLPANGAPTSNAPAQFTPDAKSEAAKDAKADTKGGRVVIDQHRAPEPKTTQATPPPPQTTTGGTFGQGSDRRAAGEGKKLEEERKASEDLAWAKAQFEQAKSLVKAQKCPQVAPIILAIQKRTPDFYNQSVATSIELKTCRAYVDNARDRDESQKSRAKRAEPSPTESMH